MLIIKSVRLLTISKAVSLLLQLSRNFLITNNEDERCCGWNGPIDYYKNADFDVLPGDIYAGKFFLFSEYSCLSLYFKCPILAVNFKAQTAPPSTSHAITPRSLALSVCTQWAGQLRAPHVALSPFKWRWLCVRLAVIETSREIIALILAPFSCVAAG